MGNEGETSDRRAALRNALIASAERVIGEHGYQALRARDLAKDVGCALGAIYGVFPDLDALIVAVKARTLDELDAEIARRFAATAFQAGAERRTASEARRQLLLLAETYLAFASGHPRQWQALFEHRSPATSVPQAYVEQLEGVFGHIERPLEAIAPAAASNERRLFARALFSAVHGVVALGLDEKLGALPRELLSWQVRAIVEAVAAGVTDHPELAMLAPAM
jgi:AcrR family transcriptional regulator